MSASFHYFMIVTIFFPFTIGADNLNCGNKTEAKPWELCCNGEVYHFTSSILPSKSCNVQPKNENLTFTDSAWLAYDCNVRKNLSSTELTLQSYMSLLLRARNSSQSVFWEALPFQRNVSEKTVGEDDFVKIQTIRKYHREGLEALDEFCTFGGENSTAGSRGHNSMSIDITTIFSGIQYYQECNNEMIPPSGYFAGSYNRDPAYSNFTKCKNELNYTLGNGTHFRFHSIIYTLCKIVQFQDMDLVTLQAQIKTEALDFAVVIPRFFPAFWSKWVKDSVKHLMFEELKLEYKARNLLNLKVLMRQKVEEQIDQEFSNGKWGTRITNKNELVQAIRILNVYDAYRKAAGNVCRLDAYRKENAEVL